MDNSTHDGEAFKGTLDRFNGVTVDSTQETCSIDKFTQKLIDSLNIWQQSQIRGVWFRVSLQQADWIPILAKHNFWFHHAHPDAVMMCRWLPETEVCNIPSYSHTMLGVGGLVTDAQSRLLVVKERFQTAPFWKLPGGYIEKGEDIGDSAIREVFEETGVHTTFNSLVAFRHNHIAQFGCSDLYLIVHLSPVDEYQPLNKCEREIEDCCWMKIDDYLEHPEVHVFNRLVVRKFMENSASGVSMASEKLALHQSKHKQVTLYTLHLDNKTDTLLCL